jgi:thiol-disulfide isomerase/thioredoxin
MKYLLSFLLLICLSACSLFSKKEKRVVVNKPFPSINLMLEDSVSYLSTQNIPEGKPVVFFYYLPYCPFCKAQLEEIIADMDILKDVQFYMVTNLPLGDMRELYKEYKLDKYPNIKMGMDYSNKMLIYYDLKGVPFMAIYDKHKVFKDSFTGGKTLGTTILEATKG